MKEPITYRSSFLLIALALLWPQSAYATRIYNLVDYPDLQNGHSLRGTITTTDDAPDDGLLQTEEILDWEWEISGANELSATFSGLIPETSAQNILISGLAIELPFAAQADLRLWQTISEPREEDIRALRWSTSGPDLDGFYSSNNNAGGRAGDVPIGIWSSELTSPDRSSWIIASAVPEPTSLLMATICFFGLFSLQPLRTLSL